MKQPFKNSGENIKYGFNPEKQDLPDLTVSIQPEIFREGIISVTKWYTTMVQHVKSETIREIQGKIEPGFTYHSTSVKTLGKMTSRKTRHKSIEPSAGFEGAEGVYVVNYRKGLTGRDLYLSKGTKDGSVPCVIRINHEKIPDKVRESFHDGGVQHTYYGREIPLEHTQYFDFTDGQWKPVLSYTGGFDELYNVAGRSYQKMSKKVFKVGGHEGLAYAVTKYVGTGQYDKITDHYQRVGLQKDEAGQLAFAKVMELSDRKNPQIQVN